MLVSRSKLCCAVKRGSRFAVIKDDDPGEHVTMLACVTVDGSKLPPFLIFPLKTLPKSLDERIKKNQLYVGGQDNGCITMQNFKEYAKVLVDWVKSHRQFHKLPEKEPFLLIGDSHNSREDHDMLRMLKENDITFLTYPSHCTHILQPLDVGVFKDFKKYFKLAFRKLRKEKIE